MKHKIDKCPYCGCPIVVNLWKSGGAFQGFSTCANGCATYVTHDFKTPREAYEASVDIVRASIHHALAFGRSLI